MGKMTHLLYFHLRQSAFLSDEAQSICFETKRERHWISGRFYQEAATISGYLSQFGDHFPPVPRGG
jgi:hypothetical protein